jgi:hypothetical protein
MFTHISGERTTSIFKVIKWIETYYVVASSARLWTLKTEARISSDMSLNFYQTLHRHITEKSKVTGKMPVTVAEPSKACTAFARSEAGIVGSNSTQGMDV